MSDALAIRIRRDVFKTIAESDAPLSVVTIAARCDLSPRRAGEVCERLCAAGSIELVGRASGRPHYRKAMANKASNVDLVLEHLAAQCVGRPRGESVTQIANAVGLTESQVYTVTGRLLKQKRVSRHRDAGDQPFRYYLEPPEPVAAHGAPTAADALQLVRDAETPERKAPASTETADLDEAGTRTPPEIGPRPAAGDLDAHYRNVIDDLKIRIAERRIEVQLLADVVTLLRRLLEEPDDVIEPRGIGPQAGPLTHRSRYVDGELHLGSPDACRKCNPEGEA